MRYIAVIAAFVAAGALAAPAQYQAEAEAARTAQRLKQINAAQQEQIKRAAAAPAETPQRREQPWWYWLAVPVALAVGVAWSTQRMNR